MTTPNQLAHFAINADDVDRAKAFYSRVFGWTYASWGPPGFYVIEGAGPYAAIQGRRELTKGQKMTGFECTIAVESIDRAEAAVLAGGGTVALPRSVIAGVGTLMFFRDTEGNTFGCMQYDPKAE